MVSKAFEVERGESNENYEKTRTRSDYEFIDELEKERKKVIGHPCNLVIVSQSL